MLLAAHQQAMRLYVRSLLPGYPDAEDVAQEAMITIWRKRDTFQPGTNFKAWAFRVAHFYVLNQRRKIVRGKWLVFDEEVMNRIDPAMFDESSAVLEIEHRALEICMQSLRSQDRELLEIRYATKTSLETFAQQKGERLGTLKARLFRLRGSLRSCIEKRLNLK